MRKKLFLPVFVLLTTLLILPSYIRAYVVDGNSDAPAYITGDRVIVNLSAYDVKLPYSRIVIKKIKNPSVGDYVLFSHEGQIMFKRVVAIPQNTIEMVDNRLIVNGKSLQYQEIEAGKATELRSRTHLGSIIEKEIGNGLDIYISYTMTNHSLSSFAKKKLEDNMYFVLGSNRDRSTDSRHFGLIPRNSILGKVIGKY